MFYTGIDPFTGKKIYVADYEEKQLQRALLQWGRPENRDKVRTALKRLGREDLIGFSASCLVKPERADGYRKDKKTDGHGGTAKNKSTVQNAPKKKLTGSKKPAGWAKSKPKNGGKGTGKNVGKRGGKK